MIIQKRNVGQGILIGDHTKVTLHQIAQSCKWCKLLIDAPDEVDVRLLEHVDSTRAEPVRNGHYPRLHPIVTLQNCLERILDADATLVCCHQDTAGSATTMIQSMIDDAEQALRRLRLQLQKGVYLPLSEKKW